MPVAKLKEFLDSNNVKYVVVSHSPAYTALEVAASAHIPGKQLAKTVMVKIDGTMAMAVLRASDRVDFERLKGATGAAKVELATEREFSDKFPGCDLGAMPPFGNLFGMGVCLEEGLTKDAEIAFNAGSLTELIRLSYDDFERLAKPKVLRFAAGS